MSMGLAESTAAPFSCSHELLLKSVELDLFCSQHVLHTLLAGWNGYPPPAVLVLPQRPPQRLLPRPPPRDPPRPRDADALPQLLPLLGVPTVPPAEP
eukprot:2326040-Rhodomonas_salina.2